MKNFNLTLKKTSFLVLTFSLMGLNVNASELLESKSNNESALELNDDLLKDDIFKKNKYKSSHSNNKKRHSPSPASQYNLRNQSKSALKSIKRNHKKHVNRNKMSNYRHGKRFVLGGRKFRKY